MRRRPRPRDIFPAPLQEFGGESEWPPMPDECLQHYGCHGAGYGVDCCPRPGEYCGQLHYESLARDYSHRPELLVRAKRADAYTRYRLARLAWLGDDHPLHFTEWLAGLGLEHEIRWPPAAR